MSASLSLQNITKVFDAVAGPAVDDISLDVSAGECVALLGPSGSGKSTVLRTIAGLDVPTAGRVIVDGTDVSGVAPERRGMAMVFQRPLLFPHLSVRDNVAFAATVAGQPRREARADAEQFLELVQLEGFGDRPITALSGGQEQRVALARALAARPRVLLLDEPFSALDPELRSDMHALMLSLHTRLRATIVMVTHDRDEAATLADRVALLREGRLLQFDVVDQLYTRPRSLEVSRLMGGRIEIPGEVVAGAHRSALGDIPAPAGDTWPEGPGTLVVRHEAVHVSTLPGAVPEGMVGVPVTVTERRSRGPRADVVLAAGDAMLSAEIPAGRPLAVGQSAIAHIPRSACSVLPPL